MEGIEDFGRDRAKSARRWREGYAAALRDLASVDRDEGTLAAFDWLAEAIRDPVAAAERAWLRERVA